MIPHFARQDLNTIFHYLGKLLSGLGVIMLVPLAVGIISREWGPSIDFILSSLVCISAGNLLLIRFPHDADLNWRQGMSLVAFAWVLAMLLGALPLFLSGHYNSYLDASFESMSAFTTTGLILVNNLDHMALAHNFWRHFMCFIGGQGIILVALTLFVRGGSAFKVYVGEAREEKIMPSIIQTAKFIWLVSLTYLIIGTGLLFFINIFRDVAPGRALFHAICLFMSGWDTAGFAVQSQNIAYYHSPAVEIVTGIIFLLGAVNFGVHYAVWTGKPRELFRNYELKVYMVSIMALFSLVCAAFILKFPFPDYISFFRKTFYQLLSAHTGVGYSNINATQLMTFWPPAALLALIIAMGLGGSATSTAGGIKILRIGLFLKGIKKELKRLTSPESAVIVEKFHHVRDIALEDSHLKMATIIIVLYIALYTAGAVVGTMYGYPFLTALFESVSASANVGLSTGVTSPCMPAPLKIVYVLQMWLGRLEFISVLVLLKFIISLKSPQ